MMGKLVCTQPWLSQQLAYGMESRGYLLYDLQGTIEYHWRDSR